MKISDILGMSLTNLWRRKTRTILTVLGVIIGTASIVVMMSLGIGLKQAMMAEVGTAGGLTEVIVTCDNDYGSEELLLGDDTIDKFMEMEHVIGVEPQLWYNLPLQVGPYETEVTLYGVSRKFLDKISLGEGKVPEEEGDLSLIVGSQTVLDFMDAKTGTYPFFEGEDVPSDFDMLHANVFAGIEQEETYVDETTEEIESAMSYSDPDPTFSEGGLDFSEEADFTSDDENPNNFNGEGDGDGDTEGESPEATTTPQDTYQFFGGEVNPEENGFFGDETEVYSAFTSSTKRVPISICGVTSGGEESYSDVDYNCYADIDVLKKFLKKNYSENAVIPGQPTDRNGKPYRDLKYSQLTVNVDEAANVEAVLSEIQKMGYYADANKEWLEETEKQFMIIEAVLGGIGGVAMLVAAISIANTMTMSTYERTKEIGIMKVLGCSLSNIRSMFLAEAAFIGFLGGVAGVILSCILSIVVNKLAPSLVDLNIDIGVGMQISQIPIWLMLLAVLFATVIGMLAGFFPAQRATRLSPLAAIRNE